MARANQIGRILVEKGRPAQGLACIETGCHELHRLAAVVPSLLLQLRRCHAAGLRGDAVKDGVRFTARSKRGRLPWSYGRM